MPVVKTGIQLDQDMRQQRREWWVQRTAWTTFTLLLTAIAFGLLGQGPISRTHVSSADGRVQLAYDRFLRRQAAETLELRLRAAADHLQLRVDNAYLREVEIEDALPQPEHASAGAAATTFSFRTEPGAEVQLRLHIRPEKAGRLQGWVSADGGAPLQFKQFVYP